MILSVKTQKNFSLIYEDDDLVVLNKKAGLAVAADRYDPEAPRLDLEAEKELGNLYAVHRIDKDTSGLILYARNENAQKKLSQAFEKRLVQKTYHALVYGRPLWETLRADMPLLPDADLRHRTAVNRKSGKPSVTDFTFLGQCGPFSWMEAKPLTGRTHQIRCQLAHEGYHVKGDVKYGARRSDPLGGIRLHASRLRFEHPVTNEVIDIAAPLLKTDALWQAYGGF